MMCYKDRTFCESDCTTSTCLRFFGEKQKAGAKAWMGDNAPVAYNDFSKNCDDYQPPKEGSNG